MRPVKQDLTGYVASRRCADVLESGREGTVHVEQVLDYNEDPSYLRDLLLYRLTIEAQKRRCLAPRLTACAPCVEAPI